MTRRPAANRPFGIPRDVVPAFLLAFMFGLLLLSGGRTAAAEGAADQYYFATSLSTAIGRTTSQPLSVLSVADQSGTDNDPARYKTFDGGTGGYSGTLTFRLPAGVSVADWASLRVEAKYRGPASAMQVWRWELRDFATGKWVVIGTNQAAIAEVWTSLTFTAPGAPGRYVNNGQLRLRYRASSGSGNSDLDYLAVVATTATPPPPGDVWRPSPRTTWQWQLSQPVNTAYDVDMYDVDLFETPQAVIDKLHSDGRIVICYLSAGSWENWRPDAGQFPAAVKGASNGWPGEKWLDIRRLDILGPIMEARLDLAASKACDGVEPDNIDGYANKSGFALSYNDQLVYNRWLAAEAHERKLSIGLKNDLEQIPDLVNNFDWALNEECYYYKECPLLDPFVAAGKAVFGVEYAGRPAVFCPALNGRDFSWLKLPLDLDDAFRIDCLAQYP